MFREPLQAATKRYISRAVVRVKPESRVTWDQRIGVIWFDELLKKRSGRGPKWAIDRFIILLARLLKGCWIFQWHGLGGGNMWKYVENST